MDGNVDPIDGAVAADEPPLGAVRAQMSDEALPWLAVHALGLLQQRRVAGAAPVPAFEDR